MNNISLLLPSKSLKRPLDALSWHTFQLRYRITQDTWLPPHKSAAWRGTLGHILKDKAPYIYDRLFECKIPVTHPYAGRFRTMPNPYIVHIPETQKTTYRRGEILHVNLTLIGECADFFPDLLGVLNKMDGRGLGPKRARISLIDFKSLSHETLRENLPAHFPNTFNSCYLHFNSPMRLGKQREKDGPDLQKILLRLAERVALQAHFHCGSELSLMHEEILEALPKIIPFEHKLHWVHRPRFSTRYGKSMPIGGWMGKIGCTRVPQELLPLLQIGQHIHIGKGSTWGLGRYTLEYL